MAKNLDIELALKDEDAKRKAREVGEAAADRASAMPTRGVFTRGVLLSS